MIKKLVSFILTTILCFSFLPMIPAAASTGGRTQADAVDWIWEQEGQYLDFDNAYGAQCVDLVKFYYVFLGKGQPFGDACRYIEGGSFTPSGWTYQYDPQPGDIAVDASYDPGHVGLVLEVNGDELVCLEQNYSGHSYCERIYRNLYSHGYTAFIRPDFEDSYPDGWNFVNGGWYYYDQSHAVRGWLCLDGDWYYMDPSTGEMQTGWILSDGQWYYLSSSGEMQTGWVFSDGDWYFMNGSGEMQRGWLLLEDDWYLMDTSGVLVTGWKMAGDYWYLFKPDGTMARDEWYDGYWLSEGGEWNYPGIGEWSLEEEGWTFVDSMGWSAKDETLRIDDAYYSFDENGYWIESAEEIEEIEEIEIIEEQIPEEE